MEQFEPSTKRILNLKHNRKLKKTALFRDNSVELHRSDCLKSSDSKEELTRRLTVDPLLQTRVYHGNAPSIPNRFSSRQYVSTTPTGLAQEIRQSLDKDRKQVKIPSPTSLANPLKNAALVLAAGDFIESDVDFTNPIVTVDNVRRSNLTPIEGQIAISRSVERLGNEPKTYGMSNLLSMSKIRERSNEFKPYLNRKPYASLATSVPSVRSDADAADLWKKIETKRRLQLERLEQAKDDERKR